MCTGLVDCIFFIPASISEGIRAFRGHLCVPIFSGFGLLGTPSRTLPLITGTGDHLIKPTHCAIKVLRGQQCAKSVVLLLLLYAYKRTHGHFHGARYLASPRHLRGLQ